MPTSPPPPAPPPTGSPDGGSSPVLTVVIPAYNEARRLTAGMARLAAAVDDGAVDPGVTEIVVVDDGSTDDTAAVAAGLMDRFPLHRMVRLARNGGKGSAIRAGVAVARGRAVAYMDADLSIDPRAVPALLAALETHDLAIGSRALPQSMVESSYVVRSVTGRLFNTLVTAGTGLRLRDTQCGCKAFRTPVARMLFQLGTIERFAFDVELLTNARHLGLRIGEVPVHWTQVPGSTVHPVHDSVPMLRDVYRARLGLAAGPAVPGLVVTADAGPGTTPLTQAVRGLMADRSTPGPPSVVDGPSGTIVLLPLVGADDVGRAGDTLTADLGVRGWSGVRVDRRVLPITALRTLGSLAGHLGGPPAG